MSWTARILEYSDEAEWLENRRAGIGASDVAGIVGLSPYASPFSVWADKVHATERKPSFGMELGKRLEGLILESFEQETGLFVGGRQLHIAHNQFEWAQATLDGLAYESVPWVELETFKRSAGLREALGVVEAKTDGSFGRWREIPDHYQIQVQWQMVVSGLQNGWLAVLHGGRRFEVYELEADLGVQQSLLNRVTEFRAKHLMTDPAVNDGEPLPPDPDESTVTARTISELWRGATEGETVELSTDLVADVHALAGVKVRKGEIEGEIRKLSGRIKIALQDAEVGTVAGKPLVSWKQQTTDAYSVAPKTYRVLRLHIEKKEGKT